METNNDNEVTTHIRLTDDERRDIPKYLLGAETVSGFVHHAIAKLLQQRKEVEA